MIFKDSNLRNVLKNGMTYLPDRKIYIFSDIISNDNDMMDKLFNLDFKIDDYHYNWLNTVFNQLLERIDNNENLEDIDFDTLRDDIFSEIEADVYTSDLTKWLASSEYRVYYLTEVLEEFEPKDGFQLLGLAQIREIEEVYNIGIEFAKWLCEEELESLKESEGELSNV